MTRSKNSARVATLTLAAGTVLAGQPTQAPQTTLVTSELTARLGRGPYIDPNGLC